MDVAEAMGKFGKVAGQGKREEFIWVDILTDRAFTREDTARMEEELRKSGVFARVLNSGSALNREAGEVQRVWLVAFDSPERLKEWEREFEERKKRDHRIIGEQLEWFHIQEDLIGPGLPLFHPKGMVIRLGLIDLIREVNRSLGAREIWTPHIAKVDLWKMSGHYAHYRDKMFVWEQDGQEWGIKAMNCPMHIQVYRFRPRSYRELPIRYAEFATVYRKEQSGELHGLARVWSLTQDDHHFIVRPDQMEDELLKIFEAAKKVYGLFGLEYKVNLSTKPDDAMGSDEIWEKAESALKGALESAGMSYEIKEKEGAFYGPKIDVDVKDSMGRWWQLTTIQLDFFMPENFKMSYVDRDGSHRRPVIIHFAILGSIERFMAVLIEHTRGHLPFWLAPVQVRILPINDSQLDYARGVADRLAREGIRVELDVEGTLNKRIRNAEVEKVAVIAVVGDREKEAGEVSVRGKGNISVDRFVDALLRAFRERASPSF